MANRNAAGHDADHGEVHDAGNDEVRAIRASAEDMALVERLLGRDESAFVVIVRRHHPLMTRLARSMVSNRAVAEEVVQETWQAVLERLPGFEGRSSLRTWIFRILAKRARTRGARERRSVPEADPAGGEDLGERFTPNEPPGPRARRSVSSNELDPERGFLNGELRRELEEAVLALPPALGTVLILRDVAGWSSEEVCNALEITETNQRVMLHRARVRVRARLTPYLEGDRPSC
jgi:RNA polymerase sigma-70 factor (ECF subfamily)